MTNQKENQGSGLEAVLEQLELSEREMQAARDFLAGRAGEEVLEGMEFRDLKDVVFTPFQNLFQELRKKRKYAELKRLFLLLFARGQATCYWLMPTELYGQKKELEGVDRAKQAAVYAVAIGAGLHHLMNAQTWESLLEFVDYNPGTLKKAFTYEKNKFVNGKFVLLGLYFWLKYGEGMRAKNQENDCQEKAAVNQGNDCQERAADNQETETRKYFESGAEWEEGCKNSVYNTEGKVKIEEEDLPLLACCEEYAVACLVGLYFRNVTNPAPRSFRVYEKEEPEARQRLMAAVSGEGLEEVRKKLVGAGVGISWPLWRMTVGLSYLNYMLSDRLKNIVLLCAAANQEGALDIIQNIASGTSITIGASGDAFARVFRIDSERYIRWAYQKKYWSILKQQISDNTEMYIKVMGKMELQDANRMLALVREQNPELHKKLLAERSADGGISEREKVIAGVLKDSVNPELAAAYLRGECGADKLYSQNWLDGKKHYYAGGNARDLVDSYLSNYDEPEFFRRCKVYMLVCHGGYFFRRDVTPNMHCRERADAQRVKGIFADFEAEGVPLIWQVFAVSLIFETLLYEEGKKSFLAEAAKVFEEYLADGNRREELGVAFAASDALGRCFAVRVYTLDVKRNKAEILACSQDSAKTVRQELLDVLCAHREFEEEMKKMLTAKRASERELAAKVLLCWQEEGQDYQELFRQALAKEKNVKIKELIGSALEPDTCGEDAVPEISWEELVKQVHSGGRKRGLAWAYGTPFPVVHMRDGAVAEEKYLQAVLLCYASGREAFSSGREAFSSGKEAFSSGREAGPNAVSACVGGNGAGTAASCGYGLSRNAALLAENLDAREFAVYVNELFDKWIAAGAEAKKRWVLYVAAIHGGSKIIEKLTRQIKEWSQHARSAIACEAVKALSLSPLPQGLLTVDGMARKFKSRQVRTAAGEALQFAAEQLHLTREELADRIVPDFGFDENMERRFDYGAREFIVTVTPELELEVFEAADVQGKKNGSAGKDGRGKRLKTLPAPGKKDDEKKAAAAYEEFKQMKKQLKTTMTSQKQRLEQALATAREWDIKAWVRLFVKNPVMRPFATGLVWGIYENGRLVSGLRYMEDGSFNTEDEREYELPSGESLRADPKIRLVHPLELPEESKTAWKQQFEDYEITQPMEQIERKVYAVEEEEADQQEMMRFHGCGVNGAVLNSRLLGFSWYQAPVEDAGMFYAYYREDAEAGFAARLDFSGNYVSGGNEEVVVYGVRFYRIGADSPKINMRGAVDEEKACLLKEVPARYFSEVVWQIKEALG